MANEPVSTPPTGYTHLPPESEPRKSMAAWGISFILASVVLVASAIAFGYMTIFLVPVAFSRRFADGQPEGRSMRNEAARVRLEKQARHFEDVTREERIRSEQEANAGYDPVRPNGPPPNVPFP